jgi:hypothetical protein
MKVVTVPAEAIMLNDLLREARQNELILETAEGQRFVLMSIETWEGFEVGGEDDFEQEVELTRRNKKLLEFLAERRSHGRRVPLAEVKEQLGLD